MSIRCKKVLFLEMQEILVIGNCRDRQEPKLCFLGFFRHKCAAITITKVGYNGWKDYQDHLSTRLIPNLPPLQKPETTAGTICQVSISTNSRTTCTVIVYFLVSSSSKRQRSPTRKLLSRANRFHPLQSFWYLHWPLGTWRWHITSQLLPWQWSINVLFMNGRYASEYSPVKRWPQRERILIVNRSK